MPDWSGCAGPLITHWRPDAHGSAAIPPHIPPSVPDFGGCVAGADDAEGAGSADGAALAVLAVSAVGAFTNADTRAKEAAKRLGEIQDAMKSFLIQWNSITREPVFSPFKDNECAGVEQDGASSDITNVRGLVSDETRDGVRWRMGTIPFEPYLKSKRCVLPADKARDLQARLMTETNQLAITCSKPAGSK